MRLPNLLRVVLFATVIGAGLIGPTAFAAEQTGGTTISSLITDDKDKDKDDKKTPEAKDDKKTPEAKNKDDKTADKKAEDDKANAPGGGNDKDKDDKAKADKEANDKADKEKEAKEKSEKDALTTKANPPNGGNAGAIFIKSGATTGPGNQPHVGCEFYVSGMNFASPSGTIAFYAWKPTGSFQAVNPVTGPSTYAGTDRNFLNGPYSLPTDGQTPHAQQGYHYKVEAVDAGGKKVNSKVFWVDCKPTTTGGGTVSQPNSTITVTVTTTPTPEPTLPPGVTPSATPLTTGTPGATPPATTTSGTTDAPTTAPGNASPPAPVPGVQPATVATATVTVVLTMPITVGGPAGPIELPVGTTITVPAGTVLTSLPGAPAPARQFVEVEAGTVLGTTAHGAVTSVEEVIGEVVLGEQVSILPTALPRTGGAPLGAAAVFGTILALAGIVARRRSAA
jgi:hypothetical protein